MPTSCGQQRRPRSSALGSCWPSATRWSGWTPPLLLHVVPQNRPPFPTPSPLGSECAKAVPQATIVAEFFPSTVRAANTPPPINSCHGQPSTHLPGAVGLNAGCQGSPERIRPEAPPPPHRRDAISMSPTPPHLAQCPPRTPPLLLLSHPAHLGRQRGRATVPPRALAGAVPTWGARATPCLAGWPVHFGQQAELASGGLGSNCGPLLCDVFLLFYDFF
jgi:hypothetical protein